jgi:uncharacterized protein
MIQKRVWRGAGALAAAAALAASAAQADAPERPAANAAAAARAPGPALWLLADEDTRIYLFGTVHSLPAGVEWNRGAVAEAFGQAEELVLETDVTGASLGESLTALLGAMATDQPPLLERVPPERRERLRQIVENTPLPMAVYDRMKTWAAAMTLGLSRLDRLGVEQENGVEVRLSALWPRTERRLIGLESANDQTAFLDTLSEATQRQWLAALAEDEQEEMEEFNEVLRAWTSGDVETIARLDLEDEGDDAELREVLLRRRNARWVEWLRSRLERPGTVFFAVGAAHLAGEDSVQDMLAQAGLRTERIQ